MTIPLDNMTRRSTVSRVQGKAPRQVPISSIRPTDSFSAGVWKKVYVPILLVRADDDLHYIVDGNQRFYRKLFLADRAVSISAWILEEGDQSRVHGNPLPQYVRDWKQSRITLFQLGMMAKSAYKDIEDQVEGILKRYKGLSTVGTTVSIVGSIKERAFALTTSVLRVLQGVTTVEQEARELVLPAEELASIYKCFVDGGRRAIQERLLSREG